MKKKNFQNWLDGFNDVFEDMLLKWKNAREDDNQENIRLPKGFHEYVLTQYMAYHNEIQTRRLVRVCVVKNEHKKKI